MCVDMCVCASRLVLMFLFVFFFFNLEGLGDGGEREGNC